MAKKIEYLEHTADLLVRASGESLAEAYAGAADALFDVITGHVAIRPERRVSLEIEAPDRESLLVRFLSELIVRHEVDRVVCGNFSVELTAPTRLVAAADMENFSSERHADGIHVKAVAYHLLEIVEDAPHHRASIRVLFDI